MGGRIACVTLQQDNAKAIAVQVREKAAAEMNQSEAQVSKLARQVCIIALPWPRQ